MLYDAGLVLWRLYLSVAALFDKKIRAGLDGRKALFPELRNHYANIPQDQKRIVVHVSSYGELEQAKPVIEGLKAKFPDAHIHLTFFSPSGYFHTKGKYETPDLISYLPFDSKANIREFLVICRPDIIFFARYDVWHNLARMLHRRKINGVLFAATFSDTFIKRLPIIHGFQRTTYNCLSKIFCISEDDRSAFATYGVAENKLEVAGDTRYDQVVRRKTLSEANKPVISGFLHERLSDGDAFVVVAGSTWESDIEVIAHGCKDLLDRHKQIYLVIAPHEINEGILQALERRFTNTSRLSFYNGTHIVIADGVGMLFELYQYADIAYVGGGFGAGVHNVLEPAVWGTTVIVGPNHHRSQEAAALIAGGSAFEAREENNFAIVLYNLFKNDSLRRTAGESARYFVESHQGACERILSSIVM